MANITTLLSINTLKTYYPVDNNLDDKYILSNIVKAQDFYIKPILGDVKINDLLNKINNNSLTSDDKTFIDNYIEPILAYECMSEILFTTAYKFKNQGLNNSTEPDQYRYKELVEISTKYHNDSQHYLSILKDYMIDTDVEIGEDYKFNSPIYLGKGYNKHRFNNPYVNYNGVKNILNRRYDI